MTRRVDFQILDCADPAGFDDDDDDDVVVVVVVVGGGDGGDGEWGAEDWPKESAQGKLPPQLYERHLRTWMAWLHVVGSSKAVK